MVIFFKLSEPFETLWLSPSPIVSRGDTGVDMFEIFLTLMYHGHVNSRGFAALIHQLSEEDAQHRPISDNRPGRREICCVAVGQCTTVTDEGMIVGAQDECRHLLQMAVY